MLNLRKRRLAIIVACAAIGIGPAFVLAPPSGAVPAAPELGGHVTTTVETAEGTLYTEYLVAPRSTAKSLADKLARKGEKVLGYESPQTASSEAISPMAAPPEPVCTIGYATSLACPSNVGPVRWARNGFTNPQIVFRDYSSSAWPVGTVVSKWNQASNIAASWSTSSCPATPKHCVKVYSANYGSDADWTGSTSWLWDGNTSTRYLVDGSVTIKLNDYWVSDAGDRREVVCHEVGHAIGLGHNQTKSSCLWYAFQNGASQYPHADDYKIIDTFIYKK
jgi:hypothetical protein